MNRIDDFDDTLQGWLRDEAPARAPDRVLNAALERVATESQRRGWLQVAFGGNAVARLTRGAALVAVIAIALFVGLQLGNLAPDVGEPSQSAEASASPIASPSPSPTPSLAPSTPALPSLSPAVGCLDSPPDVKVLYDQADRAACFGNAPLTFDAHLAAAGVVDCPGEHDPAWIYCPADGWLTMIGDTNKTGAPFLLFGVDPTSGPEVSNAFDGNVRVTGHYNDPAAQTCREILAIPGESPRPASEMIQICRQTFVVTQVVPLEP